MIVTTSAPSNVTVETFADQFELWRALRPVEMFWRRFINHVLLPPGRPDLSSDDTTAHIDENRRNYMIGVETRHMDIDEERTDT